VVERTGGSRAAELDALTAARLSGYDGFVLSVVAGDAADLEKLRIDTPVVQAFDLALCAIDAGISANLSSASEGWNAALPRGDYAVVPAPSWMLNSLRRVAPDTSGKWDIATIPGGPGNWGGSYLAIPRRAQNPEAAWACIKEFLNALVDVEQTGGDPATAWAVSRASARRASVRSAAGAQQRPLVSASAAVVWHNSDVPAAISGRVPRNAADGTTAPSGGPRCRETCWRTTATTASFPDAVPENEEVVPVNALSTWALPSGAMVGR
jgi:ABC-type glycerol-3-phosphate transport system substrate-binding protein